MVPFNFTEFIDALTNLVKNNSIRMKRVVRVDDAVKRILHVKFIRGLFKTLWMILVWLMR
ncbi:hypothetical protein SOVF_030370 [Spinacia oleracea]|nr:hypothetical protein SOVF_030370 [Spinacia oleracea]